MREHDDHFDHNLHALRIVEQFEQRYLDFPGLNLTFEVREGIVKHSRNYSAGEFPWLAEYRLDERPTLEAQLIDLVDEIAYNTADLDDGFESRLIRLRSVARGSSHVRRSLPEVDRRYPNGRRKLKFNEALKHVLESGRQISSRTRLEVRRKRSEERGRRPAPAEALAAIFAGSCREECFVEALFVRASLFAAHNRRGPRPFRGRARSAVPVFSWSTLNACRHSMRRWPKTSRAIAWFAITLPGMTDHFLLRQCNELLGVPAAHPS